MNKVSPVAALVTAILIGMPAASAWSLETAPDGAAAPGWHPPPPSADELPEPPQSHRQLLPPNTELKYMQELLVEKSVELGRVEAMLEQLRVILQHRLLVDIKLNEKMADISSDQEALQLRVAELTTERDRLRDDLASRDELLSTLKTQLETRSTTLLETAQTLGDVIAERDGLQAELVALTADQPATAVDVGTTEIAALQTTDLDTDKDGIPDAYDLCSETEPGMAVEPTGCAAGVVINLEGVNFLYDSHELTDEARLVLDHVAGILSHQPDLRLEVAGHTDAQGDPTYNQWLSLKRAEAVRDYIVAYGMNPAHIGAGGYGGQRPIADNTTIEGLQMNRRVELRQLQ